MTSELEIEFERMAAGRSEGRTCCSSSLRVPRRVRWSRTFCAMGDSGIVAVAWSVFTARSDGEGKEDRCGQYKRGGRIPRCISGALAR